MTASATLTITESGFTVTLPASTSFRLADMDPYRKLSGCNLKEMDVGWHDAGSGRVFLLELKGSEVWEAFDTDTKAAHIHLVESLGGKATDVLLVLSSVWAGTGVGHAFVTLLPAALRTFPGEGKLKLMFLVDTPASRAPLLGAVKDELNRRLLGRLRLFGMQRLTLVDFDRATSLGLPVTRA